MSRNVNITIDNTTWRMLETQNYNPSLVVEKLIKIAQKCTRNPLKIELMGLVLCKSYTIHRTQYYKVLEFPKK